MALITFSNPKWNDIDDFNPDVKTGDTILASTSIGIDSGQNAITANQYCIEQGLVLSSFIQGGDANPSAIWNLSNSEWEDAGKKDVFVSITCDNGLNESLGEVSIANIGDIMFLLAVLIAVGIVQVTLLVFGRN